MSDAQPTKRYRIRNHAIFASWCAGSLGDGRYIGMPPGTTGTGTVPDKVHMRLMTYFVPDGLPDGINVKAFFLSPDILEEWNGEPCPGRVFRYNSNGEQIAETQEGELK